MNRVSRVALGVLAVAVLSCGSVFADTIGGNCGGPSDPGACGGVLYTLTYTLENPLLADGNHLYDFTLKIDTSGLNTAAYPNANFLVAAAIGVPSQPPTPNFTGLDSAPSANWSFDPGGTNSGGCDGTGAFFCAGATQSPAGAVPTPSATVYTFVWDVEISGALSGEFASDVKAVYDSSSSCGGLGTKGCFGGLQTSTGISASPSTPNVVPEPSSMLLFGTGLTGVAALLRRRSK